MTIMMQRDEDPASADLDALEHETAYCPHCGAEVWEGADRCPACGDWFTAPRSKPPGRGIPRIVIHIMLFSLALAGFLFLALCTLPGRPI